MSLNQFIKLLIPGNGWELVNEAQPFGWISWSKNGLQIDTSHQSATKILRKSWSDEKTLHDLCLSDEAPTNQFAYMHTFPLKIAHIRISLAIRASTANSVFILILGMLGQTVC